MRLFTAKWFGLLAAAAAAAGCGDVEKQPSALVGGRIDDAGTTTLPRSSDGGQCRGESCDAPPCQNFGLGDGGWERPISARLVDAPFEAGNQSFRVATTPERHPVVLKSSGNSRWSIQARDSDGKLSATTELGEFLDLEGPVIQGAQVLVYQEAQGHVLRVSTDGGLPSNFDLFPASDEIVTKLSVDKDGRIGAATTSSMTVFSPEGIKLYNLPLSAGELAWNGSVFGIASRSDSSESSLQRFSPEGDVQWTESFGPTPRVWIRELFVGGSGVFAFGGTEVGQEEVWWGNHVQGGLSPRPGANDFIASETSDGCPQWVMPFSATLGAALEDGSFATISEIKEAGAKKLILRRSSSGGMVTHEGDLASSATGGVYVTTISSTSMGGVWVAGQVCGDAVIAAATVAPNGCDGFLARFDFN